MSRSHAKRPGVGHGGRASGGCCVRCVGTRQLIQMSGGDVGSAGCSCERCLRDGNSTKPEFWTPLFEFGHQYLTFATQPIEILVPKQENRVRQVRNMMYVSAPSSRPPSFNSEFALHWQPGDRDLELGSVGFNDDDVFYLFLPIAWASGRP